MENTVDKNEEMLFLVHVLLAMVFWTLILIATKGLILVVVFFFFLSYLFVQSGFVSYLRGSGAIITARQFPDLYRIHQECCRKLKIEKEPTLILIHADGIFNALATRFLRRNYVVLFSDVVDALDDNKEAIAFYIGHELGHIRRNHLLWAPLLAPLKFIPLLAPGYRRTQEYTCDLHGLHCCNSPDAAVKGMSALAVGARRWKEMDLSAYLEQGQLTRGFWMSYHELIGSYPWLVKRIARIKDGGRTDNLPRRHIMAWLLALFDPRLLILLFIVLSVTAGKNEVLSMGMEQPAGFSGEIDPNTGYPVQMSPQEYPQRYNQDGESDWSE